jgi:hypothetical protein
VRPDGKPGGRPLGDQMLCSIPEGSYYIHLSVAVASLGCDGPWSFTFAPD